MTPTVPVAEPMVQALGWAILHSLWQGALVATLLASANVFLRRRSPLARYAAAGAALVLLLGLPAGTFVLMRQAPASADWTTGPGVPTLPTADAATTVVVAPGEASAASTAAARPGTPGLPSTGWTVWLRWLVGVWSVGVLAMSLRGLGGWWVAQRVKRSGVAVRVAEWEETVRRLCGRLGVSRAVTLLESARVEVPTVIGWIRPVILLPASTVLGLAPEQLETILAHELAHIRRLDYFVNLLQTAVETLLFYHPAVWWVSHRMRLEREHCCDDAAVAVCGDPVRYARALAELEGLRLGGRLAMAVGGSSLAERVGRLIGKPSPHVARSSRWLAGVAALFALSALGVSTAASLDPQHRVQAKREAATAQVTVVSDPTLSVDQDKPVDEATVSVDGEDPEETADVSAEGDTADSDPAEETESTDDSRPCLKEMAELGYGELTLDELMELRTVGADTSFIREMSAAGYRGLSAAQLRAVRAHGVDGEFLGGLRDAGYRVSVSDAIELRRHGIDPEFVSEMNRLGYERLSLSRLIALRSQGITPEYVDELRSLGYRRLSLSKLLALSASGITPAYVSELRELGYSRLSLPLLIGLRSRGVTSEYVAELERLGYDGLSAGLLIELKSHGITPQFVRRLEKAGYHHPSPERLIELRERGLVAGEPQGNDGSEARAEEAVEDGARGGVGGGVAGRGPAAGVSAGVDGGVQGGSGGGTGGGVGCPTKIENNRAPSRRERPDQER